MIPVAQAYSLIFIQFITIIQLRDTFYIQNQIASSHQQNTFCLISKVSAKTKKELRTYIQVTLT